jgi:hypothetical protein
MKKTVSFIIGLLVAPNSFGLSLGTIQKAQTGPYTYAWAIQSEAELICAKQNLSLPTSNELMQIAADPKNADELKGAAFWSSEKGILLLGTEKRVADGYIWDGLVAGIICR